MNIPQVTEKMCGMLRFFSIPTNTNLILLLDAVIVFIYILAGFCLCSWVSKTKTVKLPGPVIKYLSMTFSISSPLLGAERGDRRVVKKMGASIIDEIDVHMFMLTDSSIYNCLL